MIYEGSRYTNTQMYARDKKLLFKPRKRLRLTQQSSFSIYISVQGDTCVRLARKFLNNSQLWWAIADCNPGVSIYEIPINTKMIIPSLGEVQKCLMSTD